MPIAYRAATPADAAPLAALRWAFRHHEGADEALDEAAFVTRCGAFFREALASPRWRGFIAVDSGTIVGHVFIQIIDKVPSPTLPDGRMGYLTNMYVAPGLRNRGIGAALLENAKSACRAEALELIVLWPSARSVPFYRRAGFDNPNEIMELIF